VRKSCHAPIVEPRAACARHRGSAVLGPVALWFGGPVAVPSCGPWPGPLLGPVLGGARARAHGAGRTLRTRGARPRPAWPQARPAAWARHRGSWVPGPVALWFGGPVAVPSGGPWPVPLLGPVLGGARARAHGAGRTLRTRAARPRPA